MAGTTEEPTPSACQGTTVRGKPCKAPPAPNGFCRAHGGDFVPLDPPLYLCAGTNLRGQRCHSKVRRQGDRCYAHQDE